ncbi:MAG: hypothetical protein ACRCSF_04880 [Mycobacteriaceae bacterium]
MTEKLDSPIKEESEIVTSADTELITAPDSTPLRKKKFSLSSTIITATLVPVSLIAGFAAGHYFTQNRADKDQDQAIAAASRYGALVANYNSATIDNYFSDMTAATTGNAQAQITCSAETMKQAIKTLQLTSTGSVLSTSVESSQDGTINVIVIIEQNSTWSDPESPEGKGAENGAANVLKFSMHKVNDQWKVAEIESPLAKGIGSALTAGGKENCNQTPSTTESPEPTSTP